MKKNYILLLMSCYAYSMQYVPDSRLGFASNAIISEDDIIKIENLKSCAENAICLKNPLLFEPFKIQLDNIFPIETGDDDTNNINKFYRKKFLSNPENFPGLCKLVSFFTWDKINGKWELNKYIKDDMPDVCSGVVEKINQQDSDEAENLLEASSLGTISNLSGAELLQILEAFVQKLRD